MRPKTDNLRFDYDVAADVLHVTFGTGEPSFAEEVDDLLVVEYGIYSGASTGFQLLHLREVGIEKVEVRLRRLLKKVLEQKQRVATKLATSRSRLFRKALKRLEDQGAELVTAKQAEGQPIMAGR